MKCRHCGHPIDAVWMAGVVTWIHPERATANHMGTRECAATNFVKKEGRSILLFASPHDRPSWIETWETT